MALKVELDIFSGRSNPAWELGEREMSEFESMIQRALPARGEVELPVLGYRGFVVYRPEPLRVFQNQLLKHRDQTPVEQSVATVGTHVELWLLERGKALLDGSVYDAVRDAIR